ncbi:MAG: GGDEF domain-containing protein [Myxococcota bacterium]
MSGPASRRAAVNQRLTVGFLAGLPSTLRELYALLLEDAGEESLEPLRFELARIGSTAGSLGLDGLVEAVDAVSDALGGEGHVWAVLAPLVRAVHAELGVSAMAPIALVGDPRIVSSVEAQDDGSCEPVLGFASVEALLTELGVHWPQVVVLPADQAHEVPLLREHFGADVYLYGASRDAAGRLAAVRVGAAGFMAEPLALHEVLSQVRYVATLQGRRSLVSLVGEASWSVPLAERLEAAGYRVHASSDPLGVSAVLHGLYPEAVVLGPDDPAAQAQAVQVMRQHIGRSHIALLAYGDASLYRVGIDDVLGPDDDPVERLAHRLARFHDFRRDRDDLTHIPNRAGVLESLQRFAAWSERSNQPLSVALVLAEGLSDAASQHGREAGNACRRHLAAALERGLRRVDLVGTLGGDLFVAGLVRCESPEAEKRMDEIRRTFEARVHADRRLREVSLSIGVADTMAGTRGLMTRAQDALDQIRAAVRG